MIKLNILDMERFLDTVNACTGKVHLLFPDGRKVNIAREDREQNSLRRQYRHNRNYLKLTLEIPDPGDYMSIVSYYAGDC